MQLSCKFDKVEDTATGVLTTDHRGTVTLELPLPGLFFHPAWQRSLNICSVKNCLSLLFWNHIGDGEAERKRGRERDRGKERRREEGKK